MNGFYDFLFILVLIAFVAPELFIFFYAFAVLFLQFILDLFGKGQDEDGNDKMKFNLKNDEKEDE